MSNQDAIEIEPKNVAHSSSDALESRASPHSIPMSAQKWKTAAEAPPFTFSSLWSAPVINPVNLKCYTLPIFNLANPYTRNFHLAWLGFFVAFLSWFAFPPLIPEAIKTDLKLTTAQIGNSNIVALAATLIVRLMIGPVVDRFGPRLVMAGILVVGAIPSGLAGTVTTVQGLYTIRFFIGILGATFVPCLAWTTSFFSPNIVGTANALVGGWGNMGGGATFVIMVALFQSLSKHMSSHNAWRVSFAVVPVPILFFVAAMVLIFGTDHPAGKWAQRHQTPATLAAVRHGHTVQIDAGEAAIQDAKKRETTQKVKEVDEDNDNDDADSVVVAVNEALTFKSAMVILSNPLTWLPALAYMTTFGFELAVDANLNTVLLGPHPSLGQLGAGYLASIFGFLNFVTRPLGGFVSDICYRKFGVKSKVYLTLGLGIGQGVFSIAFGQWLKHSANPSLAGMVIFVVVIAFFNEMGNGANFSMVPHCNSYNNGVMSGLVGAFGNLGGIFFALIWRFHPAKGDAWWIGGIIALVINAALLFCPKPKH